ncbi:MAG: sugar nucleotide-binding protein [Bacteriovoracaceae bacterium]|nr:sugar nucleotide-binding protein [Bacteriovoracaceae bacterium]
MFDLNSNKDSRKTILIIGINSFIGSNLAEFFRKDYRVVGTYHKINQPLPGILCLPCDVLAKDEVQLVLYAFKPDIVLYCVGLTSLKDCADKPNASDALNSAGLFNVAELAPRYGARIVYFSSQYLFSGANKNYNEMDNADVITQYGKSQASSEFYLQKSSLNYLIVRCSKVYGRGVSALRNTWFEQLQKNLKNNQSAIYDDFVHQGFIDIYYLGMVLKMCIDKNVANRLIHFSSQDTMTHYEFAKAYTEVFNESDGLLNKGKWALPILKSSSIERVDEHLHYKLDVLNIEGLLKIKMPTIRESLEFTFRRLDGVKSVNKSVTNKGDGVSYI